MDTTPPTVFTWDGEHMIPQHPSRADKLFVVGQKYSFVQHEDRSTVTHNHEFAFVRNAWMSLPENLADQFPTPESLRKRALIDAGYYNETAVDAGSNAAALRVAGAFRQIDDFSLVIVRGPIVIRRTAKSQSRRAMDKKEFQDSKTAILETISDMIGIAPDMLANQQVPA